MAAGDLFKKAARYRKQHPGMSMPDAVKAVSKAGKKPAARKKAAKKAVGKVKPRKVKIKVKPGKKGTTRVTIGKAKPKGIIKDVLKAVGISGISMGKINQEHGHQRSLGQCLEKAQGKLKQKGLKIGEKQAIRREIGNYKNAIAASKKHINALKRFL